MRTLGRVAGGFVLVGLLTIGVSATASFRRAEQQEPRILVEARTVQISDALSKKLGTGGVPAPAKNVTMPLAVLLYALGEPNAVRTTAAAQVEARVGQIQASDAGRQLEYLLPTPGGAREPKTTETPVGTVLTVRPLAVRGRDVTVHVKFTHSRAQWPQKVDAGSSLPLGPPIIRLCLKTPV